jgi:hypothetical protein
MDSELTLRSRKNSSLRRGLFAAFSARAASARRRWPSFFHYRYQLETLTEKDTLSVTMKGLRFLLVTNLDDYRVRLSDPDSQPVLQERLISSEDGPPREPGANTG